MGWCFLTRGPRTWSVWPPGPCGAPIPLFPALSRASHEDANATGQMRKAGEGREPSGWLSLRMHRWSASAVPPPPATQSQASLLRLEGHSPATSTAAAQVKADEPPFLQHSLVLPPRPAAPRPLPVSEAPVTACWGLAHWPISVRLLVQRWSRALSASPCSRAGGAGSSSRASVPAWVCLGRSSR